MVSSEYWFGARGFYNGVATQSLRFDDGRSTYLSRTPSSAGNKKTFTFSTWIKRTEDSTNKTVFDATDSTYQRTAVIFQDKLVFYNQASPNLSVQFDPKLRDPSSWYHIVVAVDTTDATSSNRVKGYVNGTQLTTSSTMPSQNQEFGINGTGQHMLGAIPYAFPYERLNGYLSETNLIDGLQLDPTYFGETKNGVWIAKEYTGSYGTNGFRLEYKNTSVGTGSSSTIGADTSGNGHHFTSGGIVASDCNMPDSPENNFATLNPLYATQNANFSEGNLRLDYSSGTFNTAGSTIATGSMKFYTEVLLLNSTVNPAESSIGISNADLFAWNTNNAHSATGNNGVRYQTQNGNIENGYGTNGTGATLTSGDILGIACDPINGTLAYYKNGSLQDTVNIDTGLFYTITMSDASRFTNDVDFVVNYGQDSSFAGNKTAQGNSDDNDIGDFYYSPPSGFLALCASNLPEPTISPNATTQADDYFNTVLYTGNETGQSITGVGFQPDWVWIKSRSAGQSHGLFDSVRGHGTNGFYFLASNQTSSETDVDHISSLDADGFTLDSGRAQTNNGSDTYVAWNWKANGTTPTKTYKVVVVSDSGNKYRFRNSADSATFAQSAVTLDLQEGGTYTFDWSDSSAQGHPIRFSLTADGTHGGGSEYTTGVVKDDSAYTTTITVASGVATLYYYCQIHSGMGGQVNTNSTFGSTNFDGSILSVSNANITSGFSIVTYSGNTDASATIGHGLSSTPELIFVKQRDESGEWIGFNKFSGATKKLNLSQNLAEATSALFNDTAPTDLVFSVKDTSSEDTFGDGHTYVAYCFYSVEGYSKVGSYTGNGDTDGAFVFTGFRPTWVMCKIISGNTGSWNIFDNKRDPFNEVNLALLANSPSGDDTSTSQNDVDFVSNGFKIREDNNNLNGDGYSFLYLAFAEAPFKYANAR